MGVLANHVPSIEQLQPGLVEVIEESGGSKQFFCTFKSRLEILKEMKARVVIFGYPGTDNNLSQCPEDSLSFNQVLSSASTP